MTDRHRRLGVILLASLAAWPPLCAGCTRTPPAPAADAGPTANAGPTVTAGSLEKEPPAAPLTVADLTRINRRLGKEPAYRSGEPRYCLLALGLGAEQRIWLVLDGDTLFADLNGNGDLTEPGEQVRAKSANADGASFELAVPAADGKAAHKLQVDLLKSSLFGQEQYGPFVVYLTLSWTGNRTFGAWGDEAGLLFFARRPQDAPVVHIGGPLQMGFECHRPLVKKAKNTYELSVGVGTKGMGKGSFSHLNYWSGAVPAGVHPTAVLEFPAKVPGAPPVRVETELRQRC